MERPGWWRGLRLGLLAAGVVWLALAVVLGVRQATRWTDLIHAEEVDPVAFVAPHDIFVVRLDRRFVALVARTPHIVGEPLFYCPTGYFLGQHGEAFDLRGRYIGGPASRGLDRYPVRVEEGIVTADLHRPIRSPGREPGGLLPSGRPCGDPHRASSGILPSP